MNEDPGFKLKTYSFDRYDIKRLETTVMLPCWDTFNYKKNQTGITLEIGSQNLKDDPIMLPAHLRSYHFLLKEQDKIQANILAALFSWYPSLREEFEGQDEAVMATVPPVQDSGAFKNMISLNAIHFHHVFKDDYAYTGYEFTCSWDEEHGLGVMMHNDRVVELGGADCSFLEWIAERDLDPEGVDAEIEANRQQNTKPADKQASHPWWKFW